MSERIVLFDGVCNLCNASVQFIIKHDPYGKIKFAALQSDAGKLLLERCGFHDGEFHSIIFIRNGKAYQQSEAVLQIVREFRLPWPWMYSVGRIIPLFIRDGIYRWVAKRRYRIFGKRNECMIPTPEIRQRFL
ncbi:MAG TPA: thiol-disulfide oxidoreductase DCC family protein [Cyclobacteriaceae bacterium]|nr:thiol-disulfide oxidoreductase DCC family protein [Cyclobacteriaceae bacterium]